MQKIYVLMSFVVASGVIAAAGIADARVVAVSATRPTSPLLVSPTDDNMPSTVVAPKGFSKVAGVSWTDKGGDHYALFATKNVEAKSGRSYYLQVDIYDGSAGKAVKLARSVKDMSEKCEFDNSTQFLNGSVMLTDFDSDGISELTFAYTTGCRSDVSPDTMKLLVLEGKDKHILRGQSRVQVGDNEFAGGTYKADGFKKAPKLLDGAKAHWTALTGAK